MVMLVETDDRVDPVEHPGHVLDRVDRDARPGRPRPAARGSSESMPSCVGQVERHRQAGRAVGEQVPEPLVGLLGRREARRTGASSTAARGTSWHARPARTGTRRARRGAPPGRGPATDAGVVHRDRPECRTRSVRSLSALAVRQPLPKVRWSRHARSPSRRGRRDATTAHGVPTGRPARRCVDNQRLEIGRMPFRMDAHGAKLSTIRVAEAPAPTPSATLATHLTERLVEAIVVGRADLGREAQRARAGAAIRHEPWTAARGAPAARGHAARRTAAAAGRPRRRWWDCASSSTSTRSARPSKGMACRLAADVDERRRDRTRCGNSSSTTSGGPTCRPTAATSRQEALTDFHFRVVQASGNAELVALLAGQLYHRVRLYRYRSSQISRRPQRALKEHHQILDAIEARDGELAEILMRRHIHAARSSIEQQLPDATTRAIGHIQVGRAACRWSGMRGVMMIAVLVGSTARRARAEPLGSGHALRSPASSSRSSAASRASGPAPAWARASSVTSPADLCVAFGACAPRRTTRKVVARVTKGVCSTGRFVKGGTYVPGQLRLRCADES